MTSITRNLGIFLLFAAIGAVLSLGIRALVRGGDPAHADEGHEAHAPAEEGHEGHAPAEETAEAPKGLLIDLGNENCPVMGGDVDGKTYTEWRGLRVGFCCPGCDGDFHADPAAVLDEAGIEWREAAKLVEAVKAASSAKRAELLTDLRVRFTVVREPEAD